MQLEDWRSIPHTDNFSERKHDNQIRDMGYGGPRTLQVSRTNVLPQRKLRSRSLRHHTTGNLPLISTTLSTNCSLVLIG